MKRQIAQVGGEVVSGSTVKDPVVGVVGGSCHVGARLPWCRRGRILAGVAITASLLKLRATSCTVAVDTAELALALIATSSLIWTRWILLLWLPRVIVVAIVGAATVVARVVVPVIVAGRSRLSNICRDRDDRVG